MRSVSFLAFRREVLAAAWTGACGAGFVVVLVAATSWSLPTWDVGLGLFVIGFLLLAPVSLVLRKWFDPPRER